MRGGIEARAAARTQVTLTTPLHLMNKLLLGITHSVVGFISPGTHLDLLGLISYALGVT